jgi:hypothetical protein
VTWSRNDPIHRVDPAAIALCVALLAAAGCAAVQQAVSEAFEEPVADLIEVTSSVHELTDGDMTTVGEIGFRVGDSGQAMYHMVTIRLAEKRFVRHVDIHTQRLAGLSLYVPHPDGRRRLTWTGKGIRRTPVRAKVGAEVEEFYLHVRAAEVTPKVVGKALAGNPTTIEMRDVNAYKTALIREVEVFARPE